MYRKDVKTMATTAKQQALLNVVSADQLDLEELRILMMGSGIGQARIAKYFSMHVSAHSTGCLHVLRSVPTRRLCCCVPLSSL